MRRPIGLLVAQKSELHPLQGLLRDASKRIIGGLDYHQGCIDEVPVVLVQVGVGRSNAAAATAILCAVFNVRCVVNSGSAGGLAPVLKIGDVVLSTKLVYGDVDNRCFNYPYGQVPFSPADFSASESLLNKYHEICERQMDELGIRVYRGLIVTVESFVATEEKKLELLGHFPEAMAVEMEGCAVAHVCNNFDVPFVVVRSISDTADNHVDYQTFEVLAGKRSAQITAAILPHLP